MRLGIEVICDKCVTQLGQTIPIPESRVLWIGRSLCVDIKVRSCFWGRRNCGIALSNEELWMDTANWYDPEPYRLPIAINGRYDVRSPEDSIVVIEPSMTEEPGIVPTRKWKWIGERILFGTRDSDESLAKGLQLHVGDELTFGYLEDPDAVLRVVEMPTLDLHNESSQAIET